MDPTSHAALLAHILKKFETIREQRCGIGLKSYKAILKSITQVCGLNPEELQKSQKRVKDIVKPRMTTMGLSKVIIKWNTAKPVWEELCKITASSPCNTQRLTTA